MKREAKRIETSRKLVSNKNIAISIVFASLLYIFSFIWILATSNKHVTIGNIAFGIIVLILWDILVVLVMISLRKLMNIQSAK